METKDIFELAVAISSYHVLKDEWLDNGLNVKCKQCNCWVSKRIVKDEKCPDCRGFRHDS